MTTLETSGTGKISQPFTSKKRILRALSLENRPIYGRIFAMSTASFNSQTWDFPTFKVSSCLMIEYSRS